MQKKKLGIIIASIIMMMLSALTFVFAWFTIVEKTQKIIIFSGEIELKYNLYEIVDEEEIEITSSIVFDKVLPGDSFDYILRLKNEGNIQGKINITFNFNSKLNGVDNEELLKAFTISYQVNEVSYTKNFFENEKTLVAISDLDNIILAPENYGGTDFDFEFSITFNGNYDDITHNQTIEITTIEISLEQS